MKLASWEPGPRNCPDSRKVISSNRHDPTFSVHAVDACVLPIALCGVPVMIFLGIQCKRVLPFRRQLLMYTRNVQLEAGESPEGALCRELHEELGIGVAPTDLRPLTFASHDYDDFHLLMPVFGALARV